MLAVNFSAPAICRIDLMSLHTCSTGEGWYRVQLTAGRWVQANIAEQDDPRRCHMTSLQVALGVRR